MLRPYPLGKHMDAIVVTESRVATDCIAFLRERRMTAASFIPLDKIRVTPLNERLRHLGGTTALVSDVITCDDAIRPAVLYAVSNTLVCDSMDEARRVCFTKKQVRHQTFI